MAFWYQNAKIRVGMALYRDSGADQAEHGART